VRLFDFVLFWASGIGEGFANKCTHAYHTAEFNEGCVFCFFLYWQKSTSFYFVFTDRASPVLLLLRLGKRILLLPPVQKQAGRDGPSAGDILIHCSKFGSFSFSCFSWRFSFSPLGTGNRVRCFIVGVCGHIHCCLFLFGCDNGKDRKQRWMDTMKQPVIAFGSIMLVLRYIHIYLSYTYTLPTITTITATLILVVSYILLCVVICRLHLLSSNMHIY